MLNSVLVLGGGSAGFLAAITLKRSFPHLPVKMLLSRDLGIIGVGEGTTFTFPIYLHGFLNIDPAAFFKAANPTWKLGIRFLKWGPRPFFDYTFRPQVTSRWENLPLPNGYYCDEDFNYADLSPALCSHDRVFLRDAQGWPALTTDVGYHIENSLMVAFLESHARSIGIEVTDDTVLHVQQNEHGISRLVLQSGRTETADLYVDCSGFASMLLGRTMGEPFASFSSSLFCDRAVVGGWDRTDEPIRPYTTAEAMNCGWCWQIEHERRVNRGYVYASNFISDEQAEREFRSLCPRLQSTRIVKYTSGCHRRSWVKNVVGIGNSAGFVEPLEATALAVIIEASRLLVQCLSDCQGQPTPTIMRHFNRRTAEQWSMILRFLSIHYRYNTHWDTPFWQACRHETDTVGAEELVDFYRENGPAIVARPSFMLPFDQFSFEGYYSLLLGQKVPFHRHHVPSQGEWDIWKGIQAQFRTRALAAMTVPEALAAVRHPAFRWPAALFNSRSAYQTGAMP